MADIKLAGTLVPYDLGATGDPSHISKYGLGGLKQFDTLAQRNANGPLRTVTGSIVYVKATNKYYMWSSSDWHELPTLNPDYVAGWAGGLLSNHMQIANDYTLSAPRITASTGFSGSGANITSLKASNISSGTLAIARGGTNNNSYTDGQFLVYDGTKITSSNYAYNSFASSNHAHGNITSDGEIGSAKNRVVKTTTNGALTTLSTAGTVNQYLRGSDATWADIPIYAKTGNLLTLDSYTISHTTGNGYYHLPSGGSSNDVLVYSGVVGSGSWSSNININGITVNGNSIRGTGHSVFGNYSHAEGFSNLVSGNYSHAEGHGNVVSGNYSHAEGFGNLVEGNYSHAEGNSTVASSDYSHTSGQGTTASTNYQSSCGAYNTPRTDSYFVVGVGSSGGRDDGFWVNKLGSVHSKLGFYIGQKPIMVFTQSSATTYYTTVSSIPTSNCDAGIFDYVVKSGSNMRCGSVYSCFSGSTVQYNEFSTNDIGDTQNVKFFTQVVSENLELIAQINEGNTWDVKVLTRSL